MSLRAPDLKEPVVLLDRRPEGRSPDLSIIVPCKNEARFISDCLSSVHRFVPRGLEYETIVVDNGSTDESVTLAEAAGADVILSHGGRIGAGRNLGADTALAPLLLFLDADVVLTDAWRQRAVSAWKEWTLGEADRLWGSWYATRQPGSWIERAWFEPLRMGRKTHMNGGHLIVRAKTFRKLGGFDPDMETGEDYEFSLRAEASGVPSDNDEALLAVHLGYPRTLRGFFAREHWHGRGDVASLRQLLGSRTAIASVLLVHATLLGGLLIAARAPVVAVGAMFLALPLGAIVLATRTFGDAVRRRWLQKWFLAGVYVAARGLSVYPGIGPLLSDKAR